MRILAIDPATKSGYAGLRESGVFESGVLDLSLKKEKKRPPTPADPQEARPGKLFQFVYKWAQKGDIVVAEGAKNFTRGKSAVRCGHELRGAIQSACWAIGARYYEVEPSEVKRFATGKESAEKEQMIEEAKRRFPHISIIDDNHADALLIYLWAQSNLR